VPWDVPEFRTGVAVGAVAAMALLTVSLVAPRRPGRPLALAGLALAAGAIVGYDRVASAPGRLVVGVIGTGVVVALCAAVRLPAWLAAVPIVPFAYVVAHEPAFARPHWLATLLAVAIPVGAAGAMAFESLEGPECITPVLLAISAAGVYWAVPDTELPACLLGVALPVALVAWPLRRSSAGRAGAAASVVPLFWAASVGGLGRPASIVGATACLGLLVGLPVAQALSNVVRSARPTRQLGAWRAAALVGAHTLLVAVASRGAGTRQSVRGAVVIAVVVGVAAVVIGAAFVATAAPRESFEPRR
jgi:hypothetical protein